MTAPTGTITKNVYDAEDRLTKTLVGTTESNLTDVADYQYDNGGSGDGNLTQVTLHPGGGQPDQVTQYAYDWRDRQVAEVQGAGTSGALITYTTYNNWNLPTSVATYAGAGVTLTSSNGVPNAPDASLLRSLQTDEYDEQGRVYQSTVWSVDPASGSMGAGQTTSYFYDGRGNIVQQISPTGLVTRYTYDGADRLVMTSQDVENNLLNDGSFETPSGTVSFDPSGSAWTFSGEAGIEQNGSGFADSAAASGNQAAFLDAGGQPQISQSVSLQAGSYSLTFDAAQASDYGTAPIQVQVDGATVATITPDSTAYATYTVNFTIASGGSHTVGFEGVSGYGGIDVIDDVALTASGSTPVSPPSLTQQLSVLSQTQYVYDGDGNVIETGPIRPPAGRLADADRCVGGCQWQRRAGGAGELHGQLL